MTPSDLFHAHMDWAAAIARHIHRALPPSFDARDLIQEAQAELWKRCQMYDSTRSVTGIPVFPGPCALPRCAFEGYAYLGVRGAVLMSIRRRHYTDATVEAIQPEMASDRPGAEQSLLARAEAQNARRRTVRKLHAVEGMLRDLSAVDGYLVQRVYLDGVELEEIAATWAQPKQTLARRLAGAVRRLKKARG